MDTFKRFGTLLIVLLLLIAGNVPSARAILPDNGGWPIVVVPDTTVITDDEHTTATVYMNKVVASDTSVTVTSSNPGLISVPSTVVVPSGYSEVEIPLTVTPTILRPTQYPTTSEVTITVTANGHSAATVVEVE